MSPLPLRQIDNAHDKGFRASPVEGNRKGSAKGVGRAGGALGQAAWQGSLELWETKSARVNRDHQLTAPPSQHSGYEDEMKEEEGMQLSVPEGLYKKSAWRPPAVINADEWIHIFILYTFYFLVLALSLLPTLYCTNTIRAISFLLFVLLSSFFSF